MLETASALNPESGQLGEETGRVAGPCGVVDDADASVFAPVPQTGEDQHHREQRADSSGRQNGSSSPFWELP
jgi:hypothetical protein